MQPTRPLTGSPSPEIIAEMEMEMAELRAKSIARAQKRPQIIAEGQAALHRLMPVAERDTGQSGVVARFLLALYNGRRFPFDLSQLRRLEHALHDDCLAVLRMDAHPMRDVHCYIQDGVQRFERLIVNWYQQGGQLDK